MGAGYSGGLGGYSSAGRGLILTQRIRASRTLVMGRELISGAAARHAPMMSARRLRRAVS